jgi:hypothetical protein
MRTRRVADVDVQTPARAERLSGRFVYRSDGRARVRVGRGGRRSFSKHSNGDVRVVRAPRERNP